MQTMIETFLIELIILLCLAFSMRRRFSEARHVLSQTISISKKIYTLLNSGLLVSLTLDALFQTQVKDTHVI